ncbi:MAG: zf-HC2 domain-containing protein [Acidobacteriota bacterium]
MTCREFADFIMDYLTGELPPETLEPFERHLSRCPNCHEYLAQYRQTVEAGRRAFACDDDLVPDNVPEDLVKAILEARKGL